jgi:membrane protein
MQIINIAKNTGKLLKGAVSGFIEDNGLKLSAALSYYTIFSLPPLLIIIISLSGIFFGNDAVEGQIFGQINGLVGNDAALQIQGAIKNIKLSGSSLFATTFSVIILLIVASGVFVEIQDSINYIWGIKAKPKKGLIKFLFNRLMSFSMIGSLVFLLVVGLIVNSVMNVLNNKLETFFNHHSISIFHAFNILTVFIIITLIFMLIFKTLPDGKIALRDCFIGASFTSVLFMVGKFGIGFYLSNFNVGSIYGAAGSIIIILAWVYYSSVILYFGAEFTKVFAQNHGKKISPNYYSFRINKETKLNV